MPTQKKRLTAEREDLVKEQKELFSKAAEEKRDLTEEELNRDEEIAARIPVIDKQLAAEKRQEELASGTGELVDWMAGDGKTATDGKADAGSGHVEVKERFEDDPKKGFKDHREMMFAILALGDDRRRPVIEDKRLRFLAAAGTDEHGYHNEPSAGFWVPEGMLPGFMSLSPEEDPLAGMTMPVPMTAAVVRVRARTDKDHTTSVAGGLQVTRKPETVQADATKQEYERVTLEAHTLFGLAFESQELASRSPGTFAAVIANGFKDAFTDKLIDERLNGNGGGEFIGIMSSPCLITVDAETGQEPTTVVYENIVNMRARCWKYAKAIWLYNHDVGPELSTMVAPSGQLIWQESARQGAPNTLLGRPAYPTEYCQTLGTKGDLVLGVWSEYLEGVLTSMQQAESVHVRFVEHEIAWKFWIENAGAPWWRVPLTPKFSSKTLSPFVVLATRS